jgi:PP-loop superfamily ATP-utilizing enzyme
MDEEVFDATPPDKIERLARICGQTNYWLAFGGGVDSADVTADMAALAMARRHECVPEVL